MVVASISWNQLSCLSLKPTGCQHCVRDMALKRAGVGWGGVGGWKGSMVKVPSGKLCPACPSRNSHKVSILSHCCATRQPIQCQHLTECDVQAAGVGMFYEDTSSSGAG